MPIVGLCEITIRHLQAPPTGFKIYLDRSIKGFGVRVTAGGAKSYVLTHGRDRKRITLGDVAIIKLADPGSS